MKKRKRILVDLTISILHNGHIRLLKKASKKGKVIVALATDDTVLKYKGYLPELNYKQRKEILSSIKYVEEIIEFIKEKYGKEITLNEEWTDLDRIGNSSGSGLSEIKPIQNNEIDESKDDIKEQSMYLYIARNVLYIESIVQCDC